MTRYYNYLFYYYEKPIMFSATVTDKMEEREKWKPVVACDVITNAIRSYTGDPYMKAANIKRLVPVDRKDTVKRRQTFEWMEEAKALFRRAHGIEEA